MILTVERLKKLLHYDPKTGIFTWLDDVSWKSKKGTAAGIVHNRYLRIRIRCREFKAHRLAWLYMTGVWPENNIDHIDTDKTNNRWDNLRLAKGSINQENIREARTHSKSGILGVSPRGNKWVSVIHMQGKQKYLGKFDTPEKAQEAYIEAKRIYHEGCTI